MFSIVLILDLIFFGFLLTYLFKLKLFLEERVTIGFLISFVFFGIVMLGFANFIGLNFFTLLFSLAIVNSIGAGILQTQHFRIFQEEIRDFRSRFKKLSWKIFFMLLLIFILFFAYLFSQLLTFKNGSYYVQPVHAYGDISLHLGIISSFAYGNNFPPQSPILSGTQVAYPFLFDFITAIFVNPLGLNLQQAVSLTGILMMTVTVLLLSFTSLRLTKSRSAAVIVLVLFFFDGGLGGFLFFFRDLQNSSLNIFQFITHLPRDYTAIKNLGFFWINVVLSMFLPQRDFLLGFPLFLLVLNIFHELSEDFKKRSLLLATMLLAFFPIIHPHTLIAISPFILFFSFQIFRKNFRNIKYILLFGLPSLIIAYVLGKIFLPQSQNPLSLMSFKLGWMADKENILSFYLKNFGAILVLLPFGLIITIKNKFRIMQITLIGLVWFILPSIFLLQPWDFDNTKLFIYWYLTAVFLIAFLLSKLLRTKSIFNLVMAFLIIFILCFSGFLDNLRILFSSGTRYEIYSPQAIKVAQFVKDNIPKNAVFLAVDKFDNPVVSLAGRKTVVGYHGWLWTYGLNYFSRDTDIKKMLSGQGKNLFQKYNISDVILFNEPTDYLIDKSFFSRNYKLIYNKDGYLIYEIL